jgi:transposase
MKGFLGIDVSKGYSDFVLLDDEGRRLEDTFQLDDTRLGHERLREWLLAVTGRYGLDQLDCAVESTGGFEDNWYAALIDWSEKMPLRVARLNPSVVKNAARAELQINTTDSESARNIASYIRRFSDQVDYRVKDTSYSAYRSLHNHLTLVTKQKSQIINELKRLLYITFPELQRYCKQSVPNWVLSLLIQYPSTIKLSKAKVEKLSKIKSISAEKALTLITSAKQSIASRHSVTDEFLIKRMAQEIEQKQQSIKEIKEYLAENCTGKETELLESITGIASYSAASIMIQIEDIARFASPKELASYFGLHPTIRESGDKQSVSRMSKKGRPPVRATLYMCANTAVLFDPHLKAIYARHRARGKGHRQALGAVMHKMLRIIWGVLSNGKPYEAKIDQDNQNKNVKTFSDNAANQIQTKRRFQEFDANAPISRLASKKRKAHATSQVDNAEHIRDLEHEPSGVNI